MSACPFVYVYVSLCLSVCLSVCLGFCFSRRPADFITVQRYIHLRKNSKLIYLAASALEVFSNWALYKLTYVYVSLCLSGFLFLTMCVCLCVFVSTCGLAKPRASHAVHDTVLGHSSGLVLLSSALLLGYLCWRTHDGQLYIRQLI